jgi:hypothetical protein
MTPEQITEERSRRLRSAFLDQEFGGAKALMDDSAFGGVVEDKESFLTSSAVAGWAGVALNRRVNPASPEWQGIKDGIARGYFKNQAASNVSDGDMFGMIAADYQAQDKIASASRIAAARGESWLGKFREVETANAGSMLPGRMTNYLGLARAAHDEMAAKVAPYRSTIKTVADMARNIDTAPDGMDWGAMASELVKVPKEDRPYVIEALSLQTPGESKSEDGERIKLAFLRGMERYIDTASTSLLGSSMADIEASARDNPLLTPAQSGEVLSASSSVADFLDLRDDMRDIATGKLAPLNAVKFAGMNIAGAAENIPMTLGSFIPYVGAAVTLGSFQRSTYNEVRRNNPTMSRDAANAIATISAPFQAVTEIASDRFLFGRLPNLKRAFTQPIFTATGAAGMFATRAAIGTATEVGEEFAQGVTPLAVQDIAMALNSDIPGSDWEGFLGEFAQNMPELISTILPLAIVGAGTGQLSDFRAGRELARSPDMLIAAEFSPESAAKISKLANAGKWSEAEDAMRIDWQKINSKGADVSQVKATADQRIQAAERLKGLQKEQSAIASLQDTTSPDYTVNVTRSPSGWQVQTGSGTVLTVDSAEAARRIAVDLRQVASQQEADSLVTVIDDYYAAGRQAETVFTGETVQASNVEAVGVVATRRDAGGAILSQRQLGPQALETVRAEAEVAGIKTGTQGIFAHINGSNEVFPMRVADGAKEIVRRMNLYKSQDEGQPQVITFLHENFESTWRLGMTNGTFSEQETRTAMRALLPAFEGVTALNAEEAQFIANLRTLANDQGNETMLRETVSEMVIRDVLGRDRQGRATGMKPGSISRAIEASVMGANTQEEVSALKSILAAIKAFTAYLKGVFGTVDAITKARDDGKIGEEYDTFINKVLGIDEVKQMESQAVEEGKAMLGVDAETQAVIDAGNMAFSVSQEYWMNHRPNADGPRAFDLAEGGISPADVYDHPEWYSGYSKTEIAETVRQLKSVRGKPDAMLTIYRASPKSAINSGDWITLSKSYATTHAQGPGDGQDFKIWSAKVKASDVRWAMDDLMEFGYFGDDLDAANTGITFSISPIRNLNELSDQVERQFKENPSGALEVKSKVIRQFAKLADKWSQERWTPQGNKVRPISEKRTVKSLDKEQAMRQAQREVELVNEGMDNLTPETLMAWSEGVGTLEDDPLVKKMLNNNGRLMSKATAAREGRNIKDQYDDLNWIPPQWYSNGRTIKTVVITRKDGSSESFPSAKVPAEIKAAIKSGEVKVKINKATIPAVGGIMPDVMANNLGFDYASEMWAALESSIKSHRAAKAGYAKAEDAVKAVERAAFEQARKEAQAWRTETDAMQKEDWSPRESLVRDLITLEAIVAMFPQEIRGKIGGFVALARKASESARLKVLQKQLERGQVLLEKHLKDQYGEATDKLFDKYRPARKAGEKPKGKLDPDAQEIADKAERAMELSADQTNAEIAAINVLLDADNISAEEEAKLETMRELVQLLGDWKNADSARRESAFLALNDVLSEGWAKWKLKQLLKREQREEMRKMLKSATGKKGVASERDKMKLESAKVLGKAARWVLNLSSFGEVMKAVFGEKAARQFIDNERNASNQYEDAIQEFSERIDEFFTTLAGGVLKGERLRFDLAQPTLTIGAGGMNERNISQLQGIQALLMWQQEDGKRHMEGPRDENGAPVEGKWSYDQAWIDELTSKLSPEAVEVKKFIEQLYGEEWVPLNAVYRERHGVNLPRHDKYAPITVTPQQAKAGEMVDPVSGAAIAGSILTPGSLRSRNRSALAEPEFRDALSTFIAHTKQMEHWKAYYDLAVEMQSVLGNRDVGNSIKAAVGDEGATVLKKWVDVFAQGGTRDAAAGLAVSDGLGRLSGRVATVGLLGRFSTLLVQSTQLAAASVRMPVGSYLKRFALLMSGNLQWSDAINSEFIQRRIKSAPPLIRQAMQNIGEATRPNQIQRVTRHLGQLLSGADGLFTAGTYAILLDYHRAMGAKMGMEGEALESYAHAEAVNATEQVAQPVRTGARSIIEVTNTNPLAKMSWAYASEARQKVALFAWSAYNAKNDPAGTAKTAFLVFVVGGLMSQLLKNLWREAKGDDDEKKWSPERLTMAALSPITSAIPGAGMIAGEGGSLSGAQYAKQSIKDVFDGKADMKDVDTVLSVLGYFNDTAGGIATLSHAGYDFAQVLENAFGEE